VTDEGFEIEGTAVERGALDSTIHREDCAFRIAQERIVHAEEKGPVNGAL
jgi:hypothetical protein